nr:hypothetical protein [uncultured Methanoregula sp.]
MAEPCKHQVAGICAVQGQSGRESEVGRAFEYFGLVLQVPKQPIDLMNHDYVRGGFGGIKKG